MKYYVIYQLNSNEVLGENYLNRKDAYDRAQALKVMGTKRIGVSGQTNIPLSLWIEHFEKEWGRSE